MSRPSVATADDESAAPLFLGQQNVAFSFERDSPCAVSWAASAVSEATQSTGDVEEFIIGALQDAKGRK
jgi:hypothetical protein